MANLPVVVRPAQTQRDPDEIAQLDYSYSTTRIYRVTRSDLGFSLAMETVTPPLHKTYPRPSPELSDRLLVATTGSRLTGYAELRFNSWNGRAEIENIAVSPASRGQGIGCSLIQASAERARQDPAARCL